MEATKFQIEQMLLLTEKNQNQTQQPKTATEYRHCGGFIVFHVHILSGLNLNVTNHLPSSCFSENITSTRLIYGGHALKIGQKYILRYVNSQEFFFKIFFLSIDVK